LKGVEGFSSALARLTKLEKSHDYRRFHITKRFAGKLKSMGLDVHSRDDITLGVYVTLDPDLAYKQLVPDESRE
jgi:hypothetical protein